MTQKKWSEQTTLQQREALFSPQFREDLQYWVKTNRKTSLRLLKIIESIMRDPFNGIGKPEPLRHRFTGAWSRRLTREHRIVYVVKAERIEFLQARYHY